MAKKAKIPKYCLHKSTGQAYSRVAGKFVYHGEYGAEASKENYDKFVVSFLSAGRKLPQKNRISPGDVSITSLCLAYLKHAEGYGYSHKELEAYRMAIRRFRKMFGRSLNKDFSPLCLQAFQAHLVDEQCSRMYTNKTMERIVRVFKWGTAQELVPSGIHEALKSVESLKKGRTTAKDYDPVEPVSDKVVEATVKHLQKIPADMVRFQRHTGCRSGEMVIMRPVDIDQSAEVWVYVPAKHKTQHHGKSRHIYIGPKAQTILLPYLKGRAPSAFCFSPKESEAQRSKDRREARKTPLSLKQARRKSKLPPKAKDSYTPDSFRRAVTRAAKAAKVELWSPHQLRHAAATEFRREFGLEASQVLLGHSSANITEIYAETDKAKAVQAIQKVG